MSVRPISTSAPASSTQFTCAHCDTTSEKMQRCSRCHFAHYCNTTCQRAHWPQHKLQCKTREEDKETVIIEKSAMKSFSSSSNRGPHTENQVKIAAAAMGCVDRDTVINDAIQRMSLSDSHKRMVVDHLSNLIT